jgi:hypothetical protein
MNKRHPSSFAAVIGVMCLFVSCASDEAIPTAERLSDALITADDIDGDWTLFAGPQGGDEQIDPSGILTNEQRELVPSLEMCDEASDEAKRATERLRPVVFRQLNLAVDDGIDPPFDRTGHLIFLQEFLYTGDRKEMENTYSSIRQGLTDCLGDLPAGEEGPGRAEEMDVPEVGDESFGVLTTIEEAGGWAEWRIQNLIVRDGPVIVSLVLVDIRADVDPYFSTEDFDEIARIAAAKL